MPLLRNLGLILLAIAKYWWSKPDNKTEDTPAPPAPPFEETLPNMEAVNADIKPTTIVYGQGADPTLYLSDGSTRKSDKGIDLMVKDGKIYGKHKGKWRELNGVTGISYFV